MTRVLMPLETLMVAHVILATFQPLARPALPVSRLSPWAGCGWALSHDPDWHPSPFTAGSRLTLVFSLFYLKKRKLSTHYQGIFETFLIGPVSFPNPSWYVSSSLAFPFCIPEHLNSAPHHESLYKQPTPKPRQNISPSPPQPDLT